MVTMLSELPALNPGQLANFRFLPDLEFADGMRLNRELEFYTLFMVVDQFGNDSAGETSPTGARAKGPRR